MSRAFKIGFDGVPVRYELTPQKCLKVNTPLALSASRVIQVLLVHLQNVLSNIWVSLAACSAALFKNVNATPKPLTDGVESLNQQGTRRVTQSMVNEFRHVSEWATAAYCKPQQGKSGGKVTCGKYKTCESVEKLNTKIYETWVGKGKNGATGFVAADKTNKKIYLSMRGSVSLSNWAADVKYFMTDCANELKIANAKCEVGFYGFWKESMDHAVSGIRRAVAENPGYRIVVTGHSLGAAAAVFAATYLRTKYPDVTLYTYGQPRAGNMALSVAVSTQGKNYRITHTNDIVPQLPWESIKSFCFGKCENYYHISPEYWISTGLGNNVSAYKVVEGYETNKAGNAGGNFKINIIAHIQYFQTNMYSCVLPIDSLVNMVGWKAGTKRLPLTEGDAFDKQWTMDDLKDAGAPDDLINKLVINASRVAENNPELKNFPSTWTDLGLKIDSLA